MANADSTTASNTMKFTSAAPLYVIPEGTNKSEIHDHLSGRLNQLNALLIMTCGCGTDAFQSWSNELQESYLWACSSIAKECHELAGLL